MNALPTGENVFEIEGSVLENKREFAIPTNSSNSENYGWYLAFSGHMSGYQNKGIMLAIQQTYAGGSGILYMNLRCDNGATLRITKFQWLTPLDISSSNVVLKTDGNYFYLYLKTVQSYQQYYIKVLQEKVLNNKNYGTFNINKPTFLDTVDEPEGTNPSGFVDKIYPVGSIYMSVNSTNPSSLFGGTWEAWGTGRVPVGIDTSQTEFATVEKTGGEKVHTLTGNEMPSHNHGISYPNDGGPYAAELYQVANSSAKNTWGVVMTTTQSTGGGNAHNNLQPYITCYMWKRTA